VAHSGGGSNGARVVILSVLSAFTAPLVFVSVIVLRKANRRGKVQFRQLNNRWQRERARWS